MHHPLPEVPKSTPKPDGKIPFRGLNVVFSIAVFLNIFSICLICFFPASNAEMSIFATQVSAAFATVISFLIDYYLWRGYNWARWLTVICGGFAVWLLVMPIEYQSTLPQIEDIYYKASNLWWIGIAIWLLLPGVARHFTNPTDTPTS
jgi:hypothetical protein